jgi:hypothetical protein
MNFVVLRKGISLVKFFFYLRRVSLVKFFLHKKVFLLRKVLVPLLGKLLTSLTFDAHPMAILQLSIITHDALGSCVPTARVCVVSNWFLRAVL